MSLTRIALVACSIVAFGPGQDWAKAQEAPPGAAVTLNALVEELERHNPELGAARREVDMLVARIAPAGAPPDPTLSVGYMGGISRPFFPSSASGGFQQFAASQEIPFPGKLALRSRIAAIEADRSRWSYEDTRLRLGAELKAAYFEFVLIDQSLAIVRRNKELLEQVARIAEVQFSVGKGLQQDILRAQLEISLLLERLAMLESRRTAILAQVNGLLYRAPETPIEPNLAFATSTLPPVDELRRLAGERYPALRRDAQEIDRSQQALALARKDLLPDFAIGVMTERPAADMPWMYGVEFMVRVPVFWQRKQRPLVAEATAALEAGRRTREHTLAMATARVTEDHVMAATSHRLTTLYRDSVIPQARLAFESAMASYQVGTADFLTLLTNFVTLLTYEINYEEQQTQYRQALARLEPLVRLELIR